MIVEFMLKNYRSFKEETVISLEASSAKGKSNNVAEVTTKNGKKFRLLKSAVIYGANASGKSNLIKAFWAFKQIIFASFKYDVNDEITLAEAFELDTDSSISPTIFSLNFIGMDRQQYIYTISVSKSEGILEETLKYYPNKLPKTIFKRVGRKIVSRNPDVFKNSFDNDKINPKRLYLSELGNSGDEYWESIRNYFISGTIALNVSARGMLSQMSARAKRIFESTDPRLVTIKDAVIRLVKLSDLGIEGIDLVEEMPSDDLDESGELEYSKSKNRKLFKTRHNVYSNGRVVSNRQLDLLEHGSVGTNALVGLSAAVLSALNSDPGIPIWIDEIDNSLHPYLCRFLVSLFNHPKANPNNAQLIFATHETTLLDRNYFRKDQIWITSKNKFGCSKLYSIFDLDIEGLRDDVPFDKWYMSGKFGGLPKIKELDFIFDRISADVRNG